MACPNLGSSTKERASLERAGKKCDGDAGSGSIGLQAVSLCHNVVGWGGHGREGERAIKDIIQMISASGLIKANIQEKLWFCFMMQDDFRKRAEYGFGKYGFKHQTQ